MLKRYRYRLYPTPSEQQALARAFGCARVVYNDAIATREQARTAGEGWLSDGELSRRLTQAKKAPERAWLNEVSSVVLQQALADANRAYRNFFDGLSGKRKDKPGQPRWRSRRTRQSIRFSKAAGFKVQTGSRLALPKVGKVRVRWSRPLPSAPSSVTVIRERDGRYYASFVVDAPGPDQQPALRQAAGVDLGLDDFAAIVYSDGTREKIPNPRYLQAAERRLARAQRTMDRRAKGGRNRDKARRRYATAHRKVRDRRVHHVQVLTHRLTRENQAVAVEDLNVVGMIRSRFGKSVRDAGWGRFLRLLRDKAAERGRTVITVDHWTPTSQVCAVCGIKDGPKPLYVRVWQCQACGALLDRDFNAALNILLAAGLAESLNACGGDIRLRLAGAVPREAGTHRPAASGGAAW